MTNECPEPWQLAAAASGEDAAAALHAEACARCASLLADERDVHDLAALLPVPELDARRRGSIAASVLARAESLPRAGSDGPLILDDADLVPVPGLHDGALGAEDAASAEASIEAIRRRLFDEHGRGERVMPPARRPSRLIGARGLAVLGLAAAAGVLLAVWSRDPDPAEPTAPAPTLAVAPVADPTLEMQPAMLTSGDGAAFTRTQVGSLEVVQLADGELMIDATAPSTRPLEIRSHNATVRVRQARFSVRARHAVTDRVAVFAGSVQVIEGGRVATIERDQIWTSTEVATVAPTMSPSPSPSPSRVPSPTPATVVEPPAPSDRGADFRSGWAALKAGDPAAAARAFTAAADDHSVGEDACYWAAVAWGRAGDAAQSRAMYERLLATYPTSARAGVAHLALGRALRASSPDAARVHLQAAATDADPKVAAAATQLLGE